MNLWRVYIITESGRLVEHWSATTRADARRVARSVRADGGRATIPRDTPATPYGRCRCGAPLAATEAVGGGDMVECSMGCS